MRPYHVRLWPSEVLDEYPDGDTRPARVAGYQTLGTIAKAPATIAAINRARTVADKDRWWELCRNWHPAPAELKACNGVLDTMPGYCCQNDAANITARL